MILSNVPTHKRERSDCCTRKPSKEAEAQSCAPYRRHTASAALGIRGKFPLVHIMGQQCPADQPADPENRGSNEERHFSDNVQPPVIQKVEAGNSHQRKVQTPRRRDNAHSRSGVAEFDVLDGVSAIAGGVNPFEGAYIKHQRQNREHQKCE